MLDIDGNQTLDVVEVKLGLRSVGIYATDKQLGIWLEELDTNGDGVVDFFEFVIFMDTMRKRQIRCGGFELYFPIFLFTR